MVLDWITGGMEATRKTKENELVTSLHNTLSTKHCGAGNNIQNHQRQEISAISQIELIFRSVAFQA